MLVIQYVEFVSCYRYSRKIIWLKVASTNSDPRSVLQFYLESVEHIQGTTRGLGCPALIRIDDGTETLIGTTHIAFRSQQNDELSGANSIRYGKSPANVVSSIDMYICKCHTFWQRIESWWSILRRHKTGWWIDTFKVLVLILSDVHTGY